MNFGKVKIKDSLNTILAHTIRVGNKKFSKGRIISEEDINYFIEYKIESLICAKLGDKDIHEDKAANILAKKFNNITLALEIAFTGRANILANESGLLIIDEDKIRKFNSVSENITIATLNNNSLVQKGEMIATIKIIPFSIDEKYLKIINSINFLKSLYIHSFKNSKCALLLTHIEKENTKINSISEKRIKNRLENLNCKLSLIKTCEHDSKEIALNIKKFIQKDFQLILILGSSAIVDIKDKIPQGIKEANGKIIRFGMPVDPGNLLLLGQIKKIPIIGLPGCARSPSLNGFDWVLEKLLSGNSLTDKDISVMGVGGLLKTINKRNNFSIEKNNYKITNIILAAGQSKRMIKKNKLLIKINKKTMIEKTIETSLNSNANNTVIVLGHQSDKIQEYIKNESLITVINKDYQTGLSSSLKCGISALPDDCDAAIIILADMPNIKSVIINSLIKNFDPKNNKSIIIPTFKTKKGNPILLDRKYFPDILKVKGDKGAKDIILNNKKYICELPQKDTSVLNDIDTKEDLAEYLQNN